MLNMRDAITIALILTLAAVVPLLIKFFTTENESLSPEGPPSEFGDDEDKDDSTPSDEWPSVIYVTGLEPLPKASLEREHVNSCCRM
jgi:hypothetical protein